MGGGNALIKSTNSISTTNAYPKKNSNHTTMNINHSRDSCACRPCTYPNGAFIIIAQILVAIAFASSFMAAGDCKFVTVPANQVDGNLTAIFHDENPDTNYVNGSTTTDKRRGLGFFFFEELDGECSWDHNHSNTTFHEYWDFLGRSDWEDAAQAGVAATALGFCFLVWLMLFSCVAHPKIVRYCLAGLLIVLLPVLQSVMFGMVLKSGFCDEYDCELGRSAHYGITAVVLYFVAGVLLVLTRDYPGIHASSGDNAHLPPVYNTGNNTNKNVSSDHDENATQVEHHEDEETPQLNGGFVPREVTPVHEDMVDISLVDSSTPTVKAQTN